MQLFRTCFLLMSLLMVIPGMAQPDSCHLRISLLTCGPGDDLYSIWGHTGVRVIDSSRQADVVFNYGTFDDRDPLFYIKFTRGIMIYSVAPFSFPDFMEEYSQAGRSVTEQVLQLTCTEKQALSMALWKNAEKENRNYPYHFYADNCTTRARDMLLNHIDSVVFPAVPPEPGKTTYRQLIHSYMNSSSQAWNRLAIDVLLGNHLDEIMNNKQAMFLPDYLMKGFAGARIRQQPLVTETEQLLADGRQKNATLLTPTVLFAAILVVMMALSFSNSKAAGKTALVLDSLFFLITGLFGLLMAVLWLARVDMVCRNNFNLLWALPTHSIIAFVVARQKNWIKYYWLLTIIINSLLLLGWHWLPQEMNNSLLLVVIILLFRSVARYRNFKTA